MGIARRDTSDFFPTVVVVGLLLSFTSLYVFSTAVGATGLRWANFIGTPLGALSCTVLCFVLWRSFAKGEVLRQVFGLLAIGLRLIWRPGSTAAGRSMGTVLAVLIWSRESLRAAARFTGAAAGAAILLALAAAPNVLATPDAIRQNLIDYPLGTSTYKTVPDGSVNGAVTRAPAPPSGPPPHPPTSWTVRPASVSGTAKVSSPRVV